MNKKKIARLMLKYNIVPTYHKKKPNYNKKKSQENTRPNLLDRKFIVTKPNQVWVTDVCEIKFKDAKEYLSVILDLYDRKLLLAKYTQRII
jgi:putative transposase